MSVIICDTDSKLSHNLKVRGSNPLPATKCEKGPHQGAFFAFRRRGDMDAKLARCASRRRLQRFTASPKGADATSAESAKYNPLPATKYKRR